MELTEEISSAMDEKMYTVGVTVGVLIYIKLYVEFKRVYFRT